MKKKLGILVLALVMAIAIFVQGDFAQSQSAQKRIENARAEFQDILKEHPVKHVEVAAFFVRNVSLKEVREAILKSPASLKGFRHGTISESGGYILRDGETLDQAIHAYERDHQFFLEKRLEFEEPMSSGAEDPELREAFTERTRSTKELLKDFQVNGLKVMGLELEGKASDIEEFRTTNPFVRVVELKKQKIPQPSILP